MDRFLKNNNVLRVIALILAAILWLGVHAPADQSNSAQTQAGITQPYPFPIQVEVGNDMVVSSMSDSTATVNVTTSLLKAKTTLPAEMFKVQLVANAQGLGAGTQVLHVAALNMPNDVKSYAIKPATITVVIEKKTHVERPIDVQVQGNVASGYSLGQLQLNTQSVDVSGSHAAVSSVTRVIGTVNVNGMKDNSTKIVNLEAVDDKGNAVQNVTLSPSSISVDVPVQSSDQKVKLQPQISGTPAPGYAVSGVTLDNSTVSEVGMKASDLPKNGLNVPVDVSGLTKSTSMNVTVPLLQGMTQVTPDTVKASVTVEPSATVTFQQVPVSVQNVPNGLKVNLQGTPTVNITLTGPQSIIQGLTQSGVQAYVDASSLKSGDTQGTVTVSVPKWVDVAQLSQRTVSVQVQ